MSKVKELLLRIEKLGINFLSGTRKDFKAFASEWRKSGLQDVKFSKPRSRAPLVSKIVYTFLLSWVGTSQDLNECALYALYCVYFSQMEKKQVQIELLPVHVKTFSLLAGKDKYLCYIWTKLLHPSVAALRMVPFVDWSIVPQEFCDHSKREVYGKLQKVALVCKEYLNESLKLYNSQNAESLFSLLKEYKDVRQSFLNSLSGRVSDDIISSFPRFSWTYD